MSSFVVIAPPLLTLHPSGQATLNREASRVLPPAVAQLRLVVPTAPGHRWRLLPDIAGGHRLSRRADRLGGLRFRAAWWAIQCFALLPPGTARLCFKLVPWGEFGFTLEPVALVEGEPPPG